MLKSLPNKSLVLMALIAAVTVTSCSKKEAPAPTPAPQPKAAPAAAIPVQNKISSATKDAAPRFDFMKAKDPFKPYVPPVAVAEKGRPAAVKKDLLPIQSYDTTKFKVSGIIAGLKENTALLIDPAGKGYVVRQGMPIGNNDGYISKITNSSVEVIEVYIDDRGHKLKKNTKLTLPQKK